jgi:hypothetical protein
MINRRRALKVLGTAGIGTAVFHRPMAAKADDEPVTPQMVAEAEWVAGIILTPAQREAAVKSLNKFSEPMKRVRAIELDNSQLPGLLFRPLTTPASEPDPRGYQVLPPSKPAEVATRPAADEELAFSSLRKLGSLLRSRDISSVELTKFYLDRLRRYDPLLKCVVTFMDDLAIKQAKQADRESIWDTNSPSTQISLGIRSWCFRKNLRRKAGSSCLSRKCWRAVHTTKALCSR